MSQHPLLILLGTQTDGVYRMPLRKRSKLELKNFNLGLSYNLAEKKTSFLSCQNVLTIQDKLETRFGVRRYNSTALAAQALSSSFFKMEDNTYKLLAKVSTTLMSVAASGAHTTVKSSLTSTTKHTGITFGRGTATRHIVALDTDGLYSYNGTTFTQLGQAVPVAPTVGTAVGSLTNSTYQVALTFYASTTGFETNQGAASANVTTVGQGIAVTVIPTTASNALIDKVRVYLKDVTANSSFLFITELSLGTASYTISANSTSTQTPPSRNGTPPASGKFLAEFEGCLVVAGVSTDKSAVYISEEYLPDAFNTTTTTQKTIYVPGGGPITGIATGYYDDSNTLPYLIIFKKYSVYTYTTTNGLVALSDRVGCVSHRTIVLRNGNIHFLSATGWMSIINSRILKSQGNENLTLGNGAIDDIFATSGFALELASTNFDNFFSVYYSKLDSYITFVSEGTSTSIQKSYNYEFKVGGFRVFDFPMGYTSACVGENTDGNEVVYISDTNGYFYTYSIYNERNDTDSTGTDVEISASAIINFVEGDDMDASYNYGILAIDAVVNAEDVEVKTWINSNLSKLMSYTYSFPDPDSGFILDESLLDVGILSDGRDRARYIASINRTGYNIAIGFFLSGDNVSLGLLSAQLDVQKNGAPSY